MTRVFVDTNILIDLLADRKPFSKFAVELFQKAENEEVKLFASSHSIATTHYLLNKHIEDKELREILLSLTDYVTVVAIDSNIIKKGLKSKHADFEDSLQIFAASAVENIDYIVTRNLKDFKDSAVRAISPDELLLQL
jgi:predicted nucleic acid-binding protein